MNNAHITIGTLNIIRATKYMPSVVNCPNSLNVCTKPTIIA